MPDIHAKLSASGSAKWLNCPGSIEMESEFPDVTSKYAEEGTQAHSLGELKVNLALGNITKAKYSREVKKLGEIPADMEDYIEAYKDYVIERYNSAGKGAAVAVELRLDYSDYAPGGFGTGDAVIASDDCLEIIDLKYGKGIEVSAEENSQLRLYALGAYEEYGCIYDFDNIKYTIYQPRKDNINSCTEPLQDLIEWGEAIVKPSAARALLPSQECIPGSYCDKCFCKARAVCRAYNDEKFKLAEYDFKEPSKLTKEEISVVLEYSEKISKWVEVVKAYAADKALKGECFPGYKVVEGISKGKYSDEDAVKKALKAKGYDECDFTKTQLIGITELKKIIGKDDFEGIVKKYIIKPVGKPTIVPETDKRPAINSTESAVKDFDIN